MQTRSRTRAAWVRKIQESYHGPLVQAEWKKEQKAAAGSSEEGEEGEEQSEAELSMRRKPSPKPKRQARAKTKAKPRAKATRGKPTPPVLKRDMYKEFMESHPWINITVDLPRRMLYISGIDMLSGTPDFKILKVRLGNRVMILTLSGERHDLGLCPTQNVGAFSALDLINLMLYHPPIRDEETKQDFIPFLDVLFEKYMNLDMIRGEKSLLYQIEKDFEQCFLLHYDKHHNPVVKVKKSWTCQHLARARFHATDTRSLGPFDDLTAHWSYTITPKVEDFIKTYFPQIASIGLHPSIVAEYQSQKPVWIPALLTLVKEMRDFLNQKMKQNNRSFAENLHPSMLRTALHQFIYEHPIVSKQYQKMTDRRVSHFLQTYLEQVGRERISKYEQQSYPRIREFVDFTLSPSSRLEDLRLDVLLTYLWDSNQINNIVPTTAIWMDIYTIGRLFRCFIHAKGGPGHPDCMQNVIIHAGYFHNHLYFDALKALASASLIDLEVLFNKHGRLDHIDLEGDISMQACVTFNPSFQYPVILSPVGGRAERQS